MLKGGEIFMNITEALERQDNIQKRIKLEVIRDENDGRIPLLDAVRLGANIVHKSGNAWIGTEPRRVAMVAGQTVGVVSQ
ncbi:hypothetical protein HY440_00955 [Candidatus Microgenomates bacterium]|nr:hypothetical protein [Candidatus Microgenomates bacterium]